MIISLTRTELDLVKRLPSLCSVQGEEIAEETAFSVRKILEKHLSYHFSKTIRASSFIQNLQREAFRDSIKENKSRENNGT